MRVLQNVIQPTRDEVVMFKEEYDGLDAHGVGEGIREEDWI